MPPALSDEENGVSSGEEEIPYRGKAQVEDAEDAENEEGDEEEGDEEEYVVEKIMSHAFKDDGVCMYEVKWLGYEKKADRTWEPEDNLAGAADVLNEYFEKIGGQPQFGESKTKKRGRKKSGVESESATPVAPAKRAKKEKEWAPPPGSWENDVDYIDTVEESPDPKTGEKARFAYVVWYNQKKTQHPLSMVYHKCPQKMLAYYESHLVFTHTDQDEGLNGAQAEEADL
ncbi:hypothetical protein K469DRAFT_713903 [Zopfia rhizophila CBS 207.26]|uniref:Chromo domain-containing protein n=1 Tax=Zopfia rhizophila CBS 207.26 TaxID=1314779 RepID=A0A6A6DPW2_9PEZI|nr:hypothetical protein K469DRAFT_713903 [Zopfia rhizophila CBS 207.26]